ncbi:LPS-assembly lipoprotein LptE [Methylomarinum vadi]|uniref:LPS-assembly lipoprotein LptE n=1 Tax=Methylomarinum vadi TaxID=438855 RepID=UPI0004DECD86|nr:LPS assembly lipoprotein LptE [Methylomarinum vadi]
MGTKSFISAALVASMLSLTACGYHLRGAVDIPEEMKSVYVEGAGSQLQREMKQSLRYSDGRLVSSPSQAGMVIKVLKDDMRRRVLALDSQGKAIEFELTYTVNYSLLDPQGKVLLKQQDLEIDREYFNSQQDILAKNNEEAVIRDEMYRQAVRSIISRARAILKN